MFEEEKFVFKLVNDSSHYLFFLGVALCCWHLTGKLGRPHSTPDADRFELLFASAIAFSVSTVLGISSFIFVLGLILSVFSALRSAREAVGLTLILYICRPWEVFPNSEAWLQVPRQCIGLWLLSWLRELVVNPRLVFDSAKLSKGVGLTLIFGIWCFLTTFVSKDVAGSQDYFLNTLFRALTLVVILHLTVRSVADAQRLQIAFFIGVSALAVFGLWRFHGFDQEAPLNLLQRINNDAARRLEAIGSLGNSNDIAAVILIPLGCLWAWMLSFDSRALMRLFSVGFCSLLMMAIFSSQSRGALLAVVAQAGMFFVQKSNHPKKLMGVLVCAVLASSLVASQLMGRYEDDLDASTESRMNYYVTGFYMLLNSPVWGQGFGRYPYEFERFSPLILHEWGLRTAHSSWVLVFSETGLVGLLLFACINYSVAFSSWRLRRTSPNLLLSYTGYSLTIIFLSHTWLMFPWILFSLIDLQHKFSQAPKDLPS